VPKKLPVTGGNLAQSIKRLMLFPDSPALFPFWRASAALRFIHVSQNEKLASHLSTFLSGNSCRTSNAAHNKEGVSYA